MAYKIGKQSLLPPKSPFPSIPPGYGGAPRQRQHQRTSSESFLIEEQPSWLDDLLEEPETPVKRPVHRRASSDSVAYFDGGFEFDHKGYYGETVNGVWDGICGEKKVEADAVELEIGDEKRVKQQFAQRSRVRKLQYIAELERHVQALHAKGLEVSGELKFLDQQNLILNLENKTLKQRLDSLVQTQRIKHLQQEMLEREITRLKLQYQQQQIQQQQPPVRTHVRRNSKDLDLQFANLSLKHKDINSARDSVTGSLYI